MNIQVLKLLLLLAIIFQVACSVTLKRKSNNDKVTNVEMREYNVSSKSESIKSSSKIAKTSLKFSAKDSEIIIAYYKNEANKIIRQDMVRRTTLSATHEKKIVVDGHIPREVQVMPLTLTLGKQLSLLPLYVLRVHIATYVVLMNVRSRRILDLIKI